MKARYVGSLYPEAIGEIIERQLSRSTVSTKQCACHSQNSIPYHFSLADCGACADASDANRRARSRLQLVELEIGRTNIARL